MPSTDSGGPEKVDAIPSERVVGMAQNEWSASIGIDGRHSPDYAPTPLVARLTLALGNKGRLLADVWTVGIIAIAQLPPRNWSGQVKA